MNLRFVLLSFRLLPCLGCFVNKPSFCCKPRPLGVLACCTVGKTSPVLCQCWGRVLMNTLAVDRPFFYMLKEECVEGQWLHSCRTRCVYKGSGNSKRKLWAKCSPASLNLFLQDRSCVAGRVLVLQPGVRPEPPRWESRVQDIGPPETSQPHIISNGQNSVRDLHLNTETQFHSTTSKLKCWTPHAKQLTRQEHNPIH